MSKVKSGLKAGELEFLISFWQRIAEEYAATENYIYEWLNYMDTRRLIGRGIDTLPENEQADIALKVKDLDAMLMEKTFEVNECIWGDDVASENGYDRVQHWYYYRMNELIFEAETGKFTKRN
jgi:hypothetical protein